MTAVVGILNKQAIALAADSAVTIGGSNGRKILNKANKVFTLSKRHPVGIMIYNSASFMMTPWETIIKVYRKQLDERSFATVKEYQNDFIEFLRARNFYADAEIQILFLENFAWEIINYVINEANNQNRALAEEPTPENRARFLELIENQLDSLIADWTDQKEICSEYLEYTFDMFNQYSLEVFNKINLHRFIKNGIELSEQQLTKIKRSVYTILRAREDFTGYTGLIFAGFGEEEIYPQLIPVNISLVTDNRLRFYIDENRIASISNDNNAAVRPFAQTDVIDTILSGIDPLLDNIYLNNFDALFRKYNQAIVDSIGDSNELLRTQIQNLNTADLVQEFNKMNQQLKKQNYISPLMNAVSSLSKEDLAEMAESLIYLTYLKRRITFAEESVGGPVDVAVISKGDGFIWIKRKHYFKPELNQQFFSNYFKH
ncbi:MAG: hypothetical protein RIE59_02045 [Imperialibacter sp.]